MSTDRAIPPVTPDSIRRAIEAANAEKQDVTRLTGVVVPLHPMPEFHPVEREGGRS